MPFLWYNYITAKGETQRAKGNKEMEKNLNCKAMATINGLEIQRWEAKKQDIFTEELKGQTKVYYDVVDIAEDCLIDSFKTLKEAKAFAKSYKN